MGLGILILILMIVSTIFELIRKDGVPRGLRGATIGLLDLEVLLGIVTWFVTKASVSFIWHPIFMVIAVAVVHMLTTSKKGRQTRIMGWVLADVLLILGASLFR